MGEDLVDHRRLSDARDDPHGFAIRRTRERVDLEDLLQEARPSAGGLGQRESSRGADQGWRIGLCGLGLPTGQCGIRIEDRATVRREQGILFGVTDDDVPDAVLCAHAIDQPLRRQRIRISRHAVTAVLRRSHPIRPPVSG